jgi:hypothetical protein
VLTRSTAWLLIVLAASPFTAPFSTCDLSILRAAPQASTRVSIERPASVEQSDAQPAPGTILDEDQFKNLTLTAATIVDPLFIAIVVATAAALRISFVRTPLITLRL